MGITPRRGCITSAAILLTLLSITAITVNYFGNHYPGNNYFPPNVFSLAIVLLLTYGGFIIQFGQTSQLAAGVKEIIYFFIVMSILALATNAAQLTPFQPIDKQISTVELSLSINIQTIVDWTNTKPVFKSLLEFIYDTLPYQMCYFPLFVIIAKRTQYAREYYFLFLISALIGFSFYYFFPSSAPASILNSNYFSTSQLATGLKFMQIHHHIQPTTLEGGMIAFPSFHVIWAWLCLYLIRGWPILFMFMLPVNLLLIASCVLLGWHFPTDLVGGVAIIIISHSLLYFCQNTINVVFGFSQ